MVRRVEAPQGIQPQTNTDKDIGGLNRLERPRAVQRRSILICTTNPANHCDPRRISVNKAITYRFTWASTAKSRTQIDALTEVIGLGLWMARFCLALLINLGHRHSGDRVHGSVPVRPQVHLRTFALKNLLCRCRAGSQVSRRICGACLSRSEERF